MITVKAHLRSIDTFLAEQEGREVEMDEVDLLLKLIEDSINREEGEDDA